MIRYPLLAALLFTLVPACATIKPIEKPLITCFGQNVSAADVTRVETDLTPPPNYADLAIECGTLGWDIGACVIDQLAAKNAALEPAGAEFKRQHAVEIRAARAQRAQALLGAPGGFLCYSPAPTVRTETPEERMDRIEKRMSQIEDRSTTQPVTGITFGNENESNSTDLVWHGGLGSISNVTPTCPAQRVTP